MSLDQWGRQSDYNRFQYGGWDPTNPENNGAPSSPNYAKDANGSNVLDANGHPVQAGQGGGIPMGAGGSASTPAAGTFDAANLAQTGATGTIAPAAGAGTPWYSAIGKALTGTGAYQNWLQAAGLGLAAYQTYRNSQPPKFKDPGLTPEQKRLSDLYFQSLTNPAMTNNASHVTDVSNSILDGYMKSNDGAGLQWTPPQTFSGQNGGAPIRQAWPGAPGGMAGAGAGAGMPMPSTPSAPNANANSSAPSDPHAVIMNERDPHVQQLAMWIVVNNPTLPPDRALEQARAIVLHSSTPSSATMNAPSAAPSARA